MPHNVGKTPGMEQASVCLHFYLIKGVLKYAQHKKLDLRIAICYTTEKYNELLFMICPSETCRVLSGIRKERR